MGLLDRVSGLFGRASEDELAAMFDPEGRAAGERGDGGDETGSEAAGDGGNEGDDGESSEGAEADDAPETDAAVPEEAIATVDDSDGVPDDEPAGSGAEDPNGSGVGSGSPPERDGGGPDRDGPQERPQAAEAATLAEDWPDRDLDLTPGSLGRLDALVDERWRADRFRDADLGGEGIDDRVFTELVRQLGCYYGEVLVRHLDGEWVDPEDGGPAVDVPTADGGAARERVFHVAAACLREPSRFADGFEARAAEAEHDPDQFGDDGADQQPAETDAATERRSDSSGGGDDGEDGVAALREAAAAFVADWLAYDLDYGVASLQRLDHLVAEEYADAEGDGAAPDVDSHLAEGPVPDVVRATAGYFGEVLRREAGGEWQVDGDPVVVVGGAEGGARVDPVAIAADVLRGEDSFAATYGTVRSRLSTHEPDAAEGPGDDGEADSVTGEDEGADGEPADRRDPVIDRLAAEAVEGETADSDAEEASPAALAEQLATAAESLADDWPDQDLDGSVESLARLDALVAREYGAEDRATEGGGGADAGDAAGDPLSLPADASLSVAGDAPIQGLAGYLAEVIRHHHDAEWRDGDDGPVLAVRGPDGTVSFDPTTVALAALAGASSVVDAYAHVAARAGLEPPLGE